MISSQRPWPLDHEAGRTEQMFARRVGPERRPSSCKGATLKLCDKYSLVVRVKEILKLDPCPELISSARAHSAAPYDHMRQLPPAPVTDCAFLHAPS